MSSTRPWLRLSDLVDCSMPMSEIVRLIRGFDAMEGAFTLARIAATLANSKGGVLGPEARSWTYDLLVQRVDSQDILERAVSSALLVRGPHTPIAHGRVVYTLAHMVLAHSPNNGKPPSDGLIAYLMLALNDHIPRWEGEESLSSTEVALGALCAESIFNRSFEDPVRFLVRLVDIFGRSPNVGPISADDWERIEQAAFGCTFTEYFEAYLAPLIIFARGWDSQSPPIIFKDPWLGSDAREQYADWFRSASVAEADVSAHLRDDLATDGLALPSRRFLETAFIDTENRLLAISPWHVRDHACLATWVKLNNAAKAVLSEHDGNQQFTAAFGYLFEQWCQDLAREAVGDARCPDSVLIANRAGTDEEIEDVVFVDGNLVALVSVKGGLVPADRLKSARNLAEIIAWLKRFFIDEGAASRRRGYRAGALRLLDAKVRKIREGAYEARGIARDATILPVVATFDHMPGGAMLYKWFGDVTEQLGLLSGLGVRAVTLLNPAEFEALLALGASGHGICRLLEQKTTGEYRISPTDSFLASMTDDSLTLRLPSMNEKFSTLTERTIARLKAVGVIKESETPA